jgi:hypothetical protein
MAVNARLNWKPAQAAALKDMAKDVRKATIRALRNAGDKAGRHLVTESVKYVHSRKLLKQGFIRSHITLKRPGKDAEELLWRMRVVGKPTPLAIYPHTQTKRGVRVRVNRGGGPKLIPSSFERPSRGKPGIFVRRTKERYPLKHFLASRVIDVMMDKGQLERLLKKSQDLLRAAFRSGLAAQLAKLKR